MPMKDAYFSEKKVIENYMREEYYTKFYNGLLAKIGCDIHSGKGKVALDIGCAFGQFLMILKQNGWGVYGLDISEYAMDFCRKKFNAPDNFLVGDVVAGIPFKRQFDMVTLFGLLGFGNQFVADRDRMLENCMKATKQGGTFIATAPNRERPGSLRQLLHGTPPAFIHKPLSKAEWTKYLKNMGWGSVEVRTLQRVPKISINNRYVFFDFFMGEPLVIKCVK